MRPDEREPLTGNASTSLTNLAPSDPGSHRAPMTGPRTYPMPPMTAVVRTVIDLAGKRNS